LIISPGERHATFLETSQIAGLERTLLAAPPTSNRHARVDGADQTRFGRIEFPQFFCC
jgi:hypothetical protein